MIHFSLFSGIGGFDLAAQEMGWKNYLSCEINDFANVVLEYYFPSAYHHRDINTLTYETIDIELSKRYGTEWRNDDIIITGGFPCQPFSSAGKRKGTSDERYLWDAMFRTIKEVQPKFVIAENVYGITNIDGGLVFEQVCVDLESQGYEVQPYIIPAASKNAPHIRKRVWFIAVRSVTDTRCEYSWFKEKSKWASSNITRCSEDEYSRSLENCPKCGNVTNTNGSRFQAFDNQKPIVGQKGGAKTFSRNSVESVYSRKTNWENFPTQSPICGRNDGIPSQLDGITFPKWRNESIRGYGNAIVPQVAIELFKQLEKIR